MGDVEQLAMFDSFPAHLTSSSTTAPPALWPYRGIPVDSASCQYLDSMSGNACIQ